MLAFINDYKRRKDIVNKYLDRYSSQPDPNDTIIGDLMKKINLKGIMKKTARVSFQFNTILGLLECQVN